MAELKTGKEIIASAASTLDGMAAQFGRALGKLMPPERLTVIVVSAMKRDKALRECWQTDYGRFTVCQSVMEGAQRGLIPDGVRAALVVFNVKGKPTCQLMPMYQGLLNLVWNSGQVAGVSCEVVHPGDPFEYDLGTGAVSHRLAEFENDEAPAGSDKIIYAYCQLRTIHGGTVLSVMPWREVRAIRNQSRSYLAGGGPWSTHPDAMARKTAIKQVCKKAPFSEDIRRAVQLDDLADEGLPQDLPTVDIPHDVVATEPLNGGDAPAPDKCPECAGPGPPFVHEVGCTLGRMATAAAEPLPPEIESKVADLVAGYEQADSAAALAPVDKAAGALIKESEGGVRIEASARLTAALNVAAERLGITGAGD